MSSPLHWEILAMVDDGRGLSVGLVGGDGSFQRCGHRHATADDATMCSWTPDPWPVVCDLHVCQVRSSAPRRQLGFGWAPTAGRGAKR